MSPAVVFDCMVFVQAAANAVGPAARCLELIRGGQATLQVSPEILAEVGEVLRRPKLRRKMPSLTDERVGAFLQDVIGHATLSLDVPRQIRYERDPKGEPYLNLAIAAGARYLVSRDNDLLDLMADEDFRARHPGLTILDPAAFLRAIAPPTGEGPG